jgi:2-polyprenyl-3-methyl-5-hydroxy-6-metoxy-1,4-benzoquinol methylase
MDFESGVLGTGSFYKKTNTMVFPRQREPEWMDDPELDPGLHRQALAGLRRINAWSRSGIAIWGAIERLVRDQGLSEVSILDLASGGGEVALQVANKAIQTGLRVRVAGCDCSPVAVDEARRRASHFPNLPIEFFIQDVFAGELSQSYDVVMCSLFLHHLDEPQAISLLRRMGNAARRMVLVDDLRRSRLGYWLAWAGSRMLSRSPVVHKDAPLSVAGAFTPEEAVKMAAEAGLTNATFETHWPLRYLLKWSHSCS